MGRMQQDLELRIRLNTPRKPAISAVSTPPWPPKCAPQSHFPFRSSKLINYNPNDPEMGGSGVLERRHRTSERGEENDFRKSVFWFLFFARKCTKTTQKHDKTISVPFPFHFWVFQNCIWIFGPCAETCAKHSILECEGGGMRSWDDKM